MLLYSAASAGRQPLRTLVVNIQGSAVQLDLLRQSGSDYVLGYLLSEPRPLEALLPIFRQMKHWYASSAMTDEGGALEPFVMPTVGLRRPGRHSSTADAAIGRIKE